MSKLYLIWQDVKTGWDTYDSAVVCADNEEEARNTTVGSSYSEGSMCYEWAQPKDVKVKYIGEAAQNIEKGVVLDSFNAG